MELLIQAVSYLMRPLLPIHSARAEGLTLIELLLVMAISAVLLGIAIPSYQEYIRRTEIAEAVIQLQKISLSIENYHLSRRAYPSSLADIGMDNVLDPWGSPYQYLNLRNVTGKGAMRKDRNLVPINTDYDLYSMGPDGRSVPPLTAKDSRDDIVRAGDGSFFGIAEQF